jgi:hypothetical protein
MCRTVFVWYVNGHTYIVSLYPVIWWNNWLRFAISDSQFSTVCFLKYVNCLNRYRKINLRKSYLCNSHPGSCILRYNRFVIVRAIRTQFAGHHPEWCLPVALLWLNHKAYYYFPSAAAPAHAHISLTAGQHQQQTSSHVPRNPND